MLNGLSRDQEARGFFKSRLGRRQYVRASALVALINIAALSVLFGSLYLADPVLVASYIDELPLPLPVLILLALVLLMAPLHTNLAQLIYIGVLGTRGWFEFDWFGMQYFVLFIIFLLSFALTLTYFIRRLRDTGASSRKITFLTVLVTLIPLLYYPMVLVLIFSRGDKGVNMHGHPNLKPTAKGLLPVGVKVWLPTGALLAGALVSSSVLWGIADVTANIEYVTYEEGGDLASGNLEFTDDNCFGLDGYSEWYGVDGFGVLVTVPISWKSCAGDTGDGVWAFKNGAAGITLIGTAAYDGTLQDYVESRRAYIENEWGVAEVHQAKEVEFAGHASAYLFEYTDDDGYRAIEVTAVPDINGVIYYFEHSNDPLFFNLAVVQSVYESVEFPRGY